MSKLTQALEELFSWLQLNYPEAVSRFRRGLSINQIEKMTKDFTFQISEEVIELYQFCNGGMVLGDYDLIMDSLESALEKSYRWKWAKNPTCSDSHIFTIYFNNFCLLILLLELNNFQL